MRAAFIALLLTAGTAFADPALPTKIREVDHLRLRLNAVSVEREREHLRAARAEVALAEMRLAELAREGEALVAAFAREYRFDPKIDRYDPETLDIVRAKKVDK